jgi:transcriptional regulator with XRE-family HTH domain
MSGKTGKETLGQRLHRLRQATGLTQADLAARTKLNIVSIRNWEGDHRTPGLWAGLQLSRALGVPLEELAECAAPDPKLDPERKKRPRQEGGRPMGRPKGSGNAAGSKTGRGSAARSRGKGRGATEREEG